MFSRNNASRARRLKLAGATLLALLVPFAASSIVSTTELKETPGAIATDRETYPAGTYQLRCWQFGRLLFEENHISLPLDSARFGIKLAGSDRNGKPIYVVDSKTATCLLRAPIEDRGYPRQIP